MFLRFTGNYKTIVLVYINGIIVTGSDKAHMKELVSLLSTNFSLKDLGDLHFFLGIEVKRYVDIIYLCQQNMLT